MSASDDVELMPTEEEIDAMTEEELRAYTRQVHEQYVRERAADTKGWLERRKEDRGRYLALGTKMIDKAMQIYARIPESEQQRFRKKFPKMVFPSANDPEVLAP